VVAESSTEKPSRSGPLAAVASRYVAINPNSSPANSITVRAGKSGLWRDRHTASMAGTSAKVAIAFDTVLARQASNTLPAHPRVT
jgi:hypothetical protein